MKAIAISCGLLALLSLASAQSLNVDIGSITPGAPGGGTPPPTWAGAAHQPGTWNYVAGIGLGDFLMVDLAGFPTAVFLRRSDGLGGLFGWNHSMTTGWFESLMDDGHNVAVAGNRLVTYTFHGLEPGRYVVTTYAWSPLDAGFLTRVTVEGSTSPVPHLVGGALPAVNTFAAGITHAVDVVWLEAGAALSIRAETAVGAGIVNAIQISHGYRFGLSQLSPGGALTVQDAGGAPGNFFLNLVTSNQGTFPNGPVFGLDLPFPELLAQMTAGAPFAGVLDTEGSMTFVASPPPPAGITLYCVGLEFDATPAIVSRIPPFSYIIQ